MSMLTESEQELGWKFFLVDQNLSNNNIKTTFANFFEIDLDDILVIDSSDKPDQEACDRSLIIFEKSNTKSDFCISISSYIDHEFEEKILKKGDIEILQFFCKTLKCNCLILDSNENNLNNENACIFIQRSYGHTNEVHLNKNLLSKNEYLILNKKYLKNNTDNTDLFRLIGMERYHFFYEYKGKTIDLPKDIATGKNDSILSVLIISKARYKDTNDFLSYDDKNIFKKFLIKEAESEGFQIKFE